MEHWTLERGADEIASLTLDRADVDVGALAEWGWQGIRSHMLSPEPRTENRLAAIFEPQVVALRRQHR